MLLLLSTKTYKKMAVVYLKQKLKSSTRVSSIRKNYTNKEQQLSQELQEESFKRLQEVKRKLKSFRKI